MAVFVNVRNRRNNSDNNIRLRRIFRDRLHPVRANSDIDITGRHRLSRFLIFNLCDETVINIGPSDKRNYAILGIIQLSCALGFYASCSFQAVV